MSAPVSVIEWGSTNGEPVHLFRLFNANGCSVSFISYGAAIQSLYMPGRGAELIDIVLGYDTLEGYIDAPFYMGAVIGRYANRIPGSIVELDGTLYPLTANGPGYHHHGGRSGFDKKVWSAQILSDNRSLEFSYLSVDGEEGFPGNLLVKVTYILNDKNQLIIQYKACTDKSTLINLTHHAYFNLGGHNSGSCMDHQLEFPLDTYFAVNELTIADGTISHVEGTPFDFRIARSVSTENFIPSPQHILKEGYDHSWVMTAKRQPGIRLAAKIADPGTGLKLTVYTSEPALHFYTGNFLDPFYTGKEKAAYAKHAGFCLETQNYPYAPLRKDFPSALLHAGEEFESTTLFEFSIIV